MKIAMLRIGIDAGSGGMQGPLFRDGTFEYIPIPDGFGKDERTYGNTTGKYGKKLIDYFPEARKPKMKNQAIHFDPEFVTFTYGDPTPPKARLRCLKQGDMLIFYCGLEGWGDFNSPPALYLMGYFEIMAAGKASAFSESEVQNLFSQNYHVRQHDIYERQKGELVLVKGSSQSRFLNKAVCLSAIGQDCIGRPLKVLSPEMQKIFGSFDGKISFQRSPTRWVDTAFVISAAEFMRSL
jgi:Nucleotide modification associated domain 3